MLQQAGWVAENSESRGHRVRTSMTRKEWASLGGMAAFILALHVIGWFILVVVVAPEHYSLGTKTFGIGIGVTAAVTGQARRRSWSSTPGSTPSASRARTGRPTRRHPRNAGPRSAS